MKIKILFLLFSLNSGILYAQSPAVFILSADEWAQPRSGKMLATLSSVRHAIETWEKALNSVLLIRYPGEDSGELWASELKDWMVSLGVPNDAIFLASGLDSLDEIEMTIATKEELNY